MKGKNKMKRILTSILLVAMLLSMFALTACPKPQDNGGDPTTTTGGSDDVTPPEATQLNGIYDGSTVTIEFWHSMGAENKALLEDAIARFNRFIGKDAFE